MKKGLFKFIKEMVPVILGVLIALLINNWNDNRKERKYMNNILESIKVELNESKENIDTQIPKQQILLDSIKHFSTNNELSILKIMKKTKGFHIPLIRTNSWIAFSKNKIELIDYKKLSTLNNIEEGKEILKNKLNYFMDFIYSNTNNTSKETKTKMTFIITDIINTEKLIKKDIENFTK